MEVGNNTLGAVSGFDAIIGESALYFVNPSFTFLFAYFLPASRRLPHASCRRGGGVYRVRLGQNPGPIPTSNPSPRRQARISASPPGPPLLFFSSRLPLSNPSSSGLRKHVTTCTVGWIDDVGREPEPVLLSSVRPPPSHTLSPALPTHSRIRIRSRLSARVEYPHLCRSGGY